ncbi:MAG: TonB-dependent receptor, partial [Phycisphaerae bacterium]
PVAPAGEIVVTATRLPTPRREVASAVTVITAEDIERRVVVTVADVLRDVPGLSVVRQGMLGHVTSVFIRGAKSEHTKVLVDGVCVNDPIAPSGGFDWGHLLAEDVERIEIVRGPQSVLYGSDAIGGVINIITKRGKGKLKGYVKAWGGSFDTYAESVGVGGDVGWLDYYASVTRVDTGGISAASWHRRNRERDGYENTSFTAKLGLTPTEHFETVVLVKGLCGESEVDDGGGRGLDDREHVTVARQLIVRAEPRLTLLDGFWEQKFAFSYVTSRRGDRDEPAGDRIRSDFHGERIKFEWQHDLHLHETNTLTFGAETEQEAGSSSYFSDAWGRYYDHFRRQTLRTCGWYVQDKVNLHDVFFATAGARVDHHEAFGRACTWRVAPAVWIEQTQTKVKGAMGTGFKAPTIYQLYAPMYGDASLQPEHSLGWEVGLEQYFLRKTVGLEAVYFANRFRNLIDFSGGSFRNVGRASTQGVELSASWKPLDQLALDATYTYLRSRDATTKDDLLRRARHKFGVNVTYEPTEKLRLTAGVSFTGGRDDQFWDPSTYATRRVRLAKYATWRFGAEYDLNEHLTVFGTLENAFNEDYEEVYGYGTPGPGAYFGVKASF